MSGARCTTIYYCTLRLCFFVLVSDLVTQRTSEQFILKFYLSLLQTSIVQISIGETDIYVSAQNKKLLIMQYYECI